MRVKRIIQKCKIALAAGSALAVGAFCYTPLEAQIHKGGNPLSFKNSILNQAATPTYALPPINAAALLQEDAHLLSNGAPFRFGAKIEVAYSLENAGTWVTLENGDRVWRMQIEADGAYSLSFLFREFVLPEGASLYIFSPDKSATLGAYTSANNAEDKTFSTEPLAGNRAVLEYREPAAVRGQGKIQLSGVVHGYRDIFSKGQNRTLGESDSRECNVNINCPVAARWQELQKATCLILLNDATALCTGALINNTRNDGKPYLLTHTYCIDGNPSNYIFLFNYQSSTCENNLSQRSYSIRGARKVAANNEAFLGLLELLDPPQNYIDVHYAGWDNGDNNPGAAFTIHHPAGDGKKFAITDNRVFPTGAINWNMNNQTVTTPVGAHWVINGWQVGTTESSSLGAPLYNEAGRISGIISGFQTNTTICPGYLNRNFAGKLAWAFHNGANQNFRLQEWLSPDGRNISQVNGLSLTPPPPPCSGITVLTAPSGIITDGSGNNNYNNNTDCSWVIKPAGAGSVTIKITDLKIEQGYDFLEIFDGEGTGGRLLARLSGRRTPNYTIISSQSAVTIRFTSDFVVADEGFSLEYFSTPQSCATPVGLTGAPGSVSAQLRWEPVAEVQRYEIQYKTADAADWSAMTRTTQRFITLLQLTQATGYDVRIRSICSDSIASPWSESIRFRTLATAICNPPQTVSHLQQGANNAIVFWSGVGNATAYQISWRLNDGSGWHTTQRTENTNFTIPNLTVGNQYEVRVRAICEQEDEPSAWSSSYYFSMICQNTEIIRSEATSERTARVEWGNINGVEGYQIAWRPISRSTWNIPVNVTGNSFDLNVLQPGVEYEVQVRTFCGRGIYSDWTLPSSFVTPFQTCSGTQIIYDAAGTVQDSPDSAAIYGTNADCRWLIQPEGAYNISLNFNWLNTESGFDFVELYDGPTTNSPLLGRFSGNTPAGEWLSSQGVVLVRFVSDASIQGRGFSLNFSANTFQRCNAPAGTWDIRPGSYSAEARWPSVAGATRYQIAYKGINDDAWQGPFTANSSIFNIVNLSPGSIYQVRIRTICSFGITSIWSAPQNFSTLQVGVCAPPRLLAVPSLDSIFVYWQNQPGARGYEIAYKAQTATQWITLPANARDTSLIPGYKYTWLAGLQPFTDYQIRVRSICSAGTMTAFSDELRLSTGNPHCSGAQILTAPNGRITDGSGIWPYSLGLNCQWLIRSGGRINLNFVRFNTVSNTDFVEIFDGENANAPLIGRFSGNALPNNGDFFTTSGTNALVRFRSNFFTAGEGFELLYQTPGFKTAENALEAAFTVYPNPGNGKIAVTLNSQLPNERGNLSFVDITGRVVREYFVQSNAQGEIEEQLDITELANGVYTLKASFGGSAYVTKIVKN